VSPNATVTRDEARFVHEAFLYAGETEFVQGALSFVRSALDADEPVLVVVAAPKIRALRDALGDDADRAHFADMCEVGANPARIIPAWRAFVSDHGHGGRRVRGIGEPISADRALDELVECQRHEDLLNVAFHDDQAWWLLCPYDTAALGAAVIDEARRSHPFVWDGDVRRASPTVRSLDEMAAPFSAPLPDPPGAPRRHVFVGAESLPAVRRIVDEFAAGAGLAADDRAALVLAAHEVAANSVRHGQGEGVLRVWSTDGAVVCEVRDRGRLDSPLAGREHPALDRPDGRGLWLAHQLCDLVQIRSFASGTVVRLHLRVREVSGRPGSPSRPRGGSSRAADPG
jgi:anti-sigma regulatory factor (Ser/Thr protein kinase)